MHEYVFCSLARDCGNYIDNYFSFLDSCPKEIKKKIIIAEDSSSDGTRKKILKRSQKDSDLIFIDLTFLNSVEDKIHKLSLGREYIKQYIHNKNILTKFVCVVDIDNVFDTDLNYHNFYSSIKQLKSDKYFAISANSKPYYYDILNFRDRNFSLYKKFSYFQSKINFITAYFFRKKYVYNIQKLLSSRSKIIAISSFNGMCIYKYKYYKISSYLNKKNYSYPEHLNFNEIIYNKKKKYILTTNNLVFKTPKEHMPVFNIISFILSKLKKFLF